MSFGKATRHANGRAGLFIIVVSDRGVPVSFVFQVSTNGFIQTLTEVVFSF